MRFRALLFCCSLLLVPCARGWAQAPATDPSFLLTATARDFDAYFPSYLANGYFSTMTSVRGTEPDRAYMVAFMDYTKGDISRPAAIPGWSEIDYNPRSEERRVGKECRYTWAPDQYKKKITGLVTNRRHREST